MISNTLGHSADVHARFPHSEGSDQLSVTLQRNELADFKSLSRGPAYQRHPFTA